MSVMHRRFGPTRNPIAHRRWLCRGLVFAIVTLGLAVPTANAGIGWCRTDPVVVIDGQIADIFVSARFDDLTKVTGPTEIVVATPVGIDGQLAIATIGFGYGEKVTFQESPSLQVTTEGIELRIKFRVPARSDAMPIRVEFAPHLVGALAPVEADGHANEWIVLRPHL